MVNSKPKKVKASKKQNKMNKVTAANLPRTTNKSELQLRKPINRNLPAKLSNKVMSMVDQAYITCRTNPWSHTRSNGIPDGTGARRIVTDHRTFSDVTLGAGLTTFSILIVPGLPNVAFIKAGIGSQIYGITTPAGPYAPNQGSTNQDLTKNWVPFSWHSELLPTGNTNLDPSVASSAPYQAARVRLVTQAYDLIYTGTASLAAGIITTKPVKLSSVMGEFNSTATQPFIDSAGNSSNWAITSRVRGYDFQISNSQYTKETSQFRPEVSLSGLLRHYGPVHRWYDVENRPFIPATTNGGSLDVATGSFTSFSAPIASGNFGTELFLDPDWECHLIQYQGNGSAAVSFRLETLSCYEFELQNNSVFVPLSHGPPAAKPQSVEAVNHVLSSSPPVLEKSNREFWLKSVMKTLSTVGLAASPFLGAAAAPVGAISTALGALSFA